MNLTKILSLSLLLSFSAQATYGENVMIAAKYSPAVLLAASASRLFWKDPKPDAKPRYNIEKLYDVELAKNDPKAYLENYWLLVDDGFIGQYFKDKHMVAKPDGTIKQSRKAMPFGVLGWTYSYVKTQKKAADFIIPLAAAKVAFSNPEEFKKWMGFAGKEKDAKPEAPATADNSAFIKQLLEQNKAALKEVQEARKADQDETRQYREESLRLQNQLLELQKQLNASQDDTENTNA